MVHCSILGMVFNIKISSTAPSSRGLSRAPPHHSTPSRPNTSPGVAVVEHDGGGGGGGCLALPALDLQPRASILLVVSFAADGGSGYLAFPPPNLQVLTQRILNLYARCRLQQRQWLPRFP